MPPVKSVYMFTDMEGVAGVDNWDPRHFEYANQAKGVYERSEVQRLLTGEINAACQGLFDAGVEEVIVNDAHGAGRTILVEDLLPGVLIVRGLNRPHWMVGLTRRCDALVQVAMHAMSDTPNGNLCHTMSKSIKAYRVNGRDVGEMELAAYLAGDLGIPWIFTSGDLHACRESEAWVPGIVTAPVKEGLSELSAIHLAPVDARKLIRERVREAVAKAGEIEPLVAKAPVSMEIEWREPGPAEVKGDGERVSPFAVRWTGPSMWEVFNRARGTVVPLPE